MIGIDTGLNIDGVTICGGGAKSKIWCEIFASIFNLPVSTLQNEYGASFGAAIIAMVGCNEYSSFEETTSKLITFNNTYYPNKNLVEKYNKKY